MKAKKENLKNKSKNIETVENAETIDNPEIQENEKTVENTETDNKGNKDNKDNKDKDAKNTPKILTKEEKAKKVVREVIGWICMFILAMCIAYFIDNYLIINANVPSSSMENTIMKKSRMIGFRWSYKNSSPERGDIIIFKYPDDESQLYVKRVIGLPGETVEIKNGKVNITNRQDCTEDGILEEDYLKEDWVVCNNNMMYVVPEGSYFVMGDNRNNSWDSRKWSKTFVTDDEILGKAVFVYWPFSRLGTID